MRLKVKVEESFRSSIKNFSNMKVEYGGAIFGSKKLCNIFVLKVITSKSGEKYKIEFFDKDWPLFINPTKMLLLGTWHLHPGMNSRLPSKIDLEQWKDWDKNLIHVIANSNGFSIYFRERKIYDEDY